MSCLPRPPPPPAVSQLSAFRSPSRSPQRSQPGQRLTRMRIRERLCPNLLLRPRPWPPSDTDLCWSLPDTHISPAPSQTTGCPCFRPPPSLTTTDTHCQASHRFRHTEITSESNIQSKDLKSLIIFWVQSIRKDRKERKFFK